MRRFAGEEGYSGKDVVKNWIKGGDNDIGYMESHLPFSLDDLKKTEPKSKVPADENADAVEVTALQLDSARFHTREDLSAFDFSGVVIRFESSPEAENEFNDKLAKDLKISKWGDDKYLNSPIADVTNFAPKKAGDADETK